MADINTFSNRYNLVKQFPAFSNLGWFDVQRIAQKAIIAEYKKGDLICKEGNPPDFLYCLVSGRVQAYTKIGSGQKENVDFIHRGMYFGIISAMTGENHSMNFEALNDSLVVKIAKDDLHLIMKKIPQLGAEFSQTLSKRIRRNVKGTDTTFESTILSIYSPLKNTGSSTYAFNLALNLQKQTKKKVILVNIVSKLENNTNNQENNDHAMAPKWLSAPVNINDIRPESGNVFKHIIKENLSIDLLNVVFDPDEKNTKEKIAPLVSTLVGEYDFLVVDLPNEMDEVVLATLTQSDLVHLLSFDKKDDLTLIRNVIDQLEHTLKDKFREEQIHVIVRPEDPKSYPTFDEISEIIDFKVYNRLPHVAAEDLTIEIKTSSLSCRICDFQNEYSKVVIHIAREIGQVLVGLVLGGGAAFGLAHIGVLRVLEEENIPIDIVAGSSMGALIGSLWAVGKSAQEIEKLSKDFKTITRAMGLLDPILPISGFIGGKAITQWLKLQMGNKTFYHTNVPLKVVAYDLMKREELVIDRGFIVDAVRQSISIPGVFEPVKNEDQVIIDGGVMNPLPVSVLTSRKINKIIAVNVLQSPEDAAKTFEMAKSARLEKEKVSFYNAPLKYIRYRLNKVLRNTFYPTISETITLTLQSAEYVISEESAQHADVVIHPNLVGVDWYELYKAEELIKRGEDAARQCLPKIKDLFVEK